MKQDAPPHPSRELLLGYAQGRLAGDQSGAVEAHLSGCAACLQVLDQVGLRDPLVQVLRSLHSDSPSERFSPFVYPVRPPSAPKEGAEPPVELANHPRYRLGDFIGGGGMGQVWKAQHLLMDRTVAIKIIHPRLLQSASIVARFRREVQAAARLDHANIVRAHDAEVIGGLHFLVMEYVDGMNLAALVAAKGPLPIGEACACIRQAAQGLQHAHEHGVVHRDIKPQNLMLSGGVVKILDFGLACFQHDSDLVQRETLPEASSRLTGLDAAMGTPDYLAPEQASNAHRADIRADIYSLGCTFYFLLTGRAPFAGERDFHRRESTPPTPLAQYRSDVPEPLARIVERMLAGEQSRRFQKPAEIVAALAPYLQEPQRSRRRLLVPAAALVGFLAAGAILAASFLGEGSGQPRTNQDQSAGQTSACTTHRSGDVFRLTGHAGMVRSVVFAPDGRHVLSGSADGTVRLWELDSGQEVGRFLDRGSNVASVAYSPDGQLVFASTVGARVRAWDAATGRQVFVVHGLLGDLRFTPDGKRLLTKGVHGLSLWNAKSGELLDGRDLRRDTVAHVLLPDGCRAWYATADSPILSLLDLKTGKELHRLDGQAPKLHALALSADTRRLLSCGDDGEVRVWDLDVLAQTRGLRGHNDAVLCVAVSPDGRFALSGGKDGSVRFWDVDLEKQLACFKGHTDHVLSVALSPDGRLAASGSQDQTIRVWRLPE